MNDLKQRHEIAVTELALNSLGVEFLSIRPGIPGIEPDCVVLGNDAVSGVEVTDAYYSGGAAKATREAATYPTSTAPRLFFSGPIHEPDKSIVEETCQRLQAKEKKNYKVNRPLWLLINMQAVMTDDEVLDEFANGLSGNYRLTDSPILHSLLFTDMPIQIDHPIDASW